MTLAARGCSYLPSVERSLRVRLERNVVYIVVNFKTTGNNCTIDLNIGLTSNVTNEEIKSHIESCEICKNVLRRMQEPEPKQIEPSQVAQIDYLKNTRKKSNRVIVISFLTAVVLIAVVLFIKFYCVI